MRMFDSRKILAFGVTSVDFHTCGACSRSQGCCCREGSRNDDEWRLCRGPYLDRPVQPELPILN
jgi:hypothetical protein